MNLLHRYYYSCYISVSRYSKNLFYISLSTIQKNNFLFLEQYTSASCYYAHSIFNPSTAETYVLRFSKQETIVTFLLYLGVNQLTIFKNPSVCSLCGPKLLSCGQSVPPSLNPMKYKAQI